jgi:hypothetical protein
MKRLFIALLFSTSFAGSAFAQALAPTINKVFNPSSVELNGNSDATITVTNPNAFPITNVQFSDTMPAGIDLITQVGGTCSTLATGGGMFSINPGTETFSSTSSVLAAGQSCTIIVRTRGIALGAHVNTTSQVTSNETPSGGPASGTLTVSGKLDQTITFDALTDKTFGDAAFEVSATASSSLTVAFSSTTTSVCTVSVTTVRIVAAGTCTIAADQPGDATYNAAPQVTQSFAVSKAAQTITFNALSGRTFGDAPLAVNATASSTLAVAFSSTTTSVCTVSGSTVTIVAVGTCTVAADQAGNSNYNAAPQVMQSFAVSKAAQTITFGALTDKTFGADAFGVSATASSMLTVAFSSTTTSVCTVSVTTVTIVAAGTCTIAADQAGDATYNAAPQVTRSFTVGKASQTIAFAAVGTKTTADAPFTVSATATSSLTVSFSSTTASICTVSGTTVTLVTLGVCTLAADQTGNANYNAAAQVQNTFVVNGPSAARMALDLPVTATVVPATFPFDVSGWAVDLGAGAGIGVNTVHVWAFPLVNGVFSSSGVWIGSADATITRDDVAAVFGNQFTLSGWSMTAGGLAPGRYRLGAYAYSSIAGTYNNFQFVEITSQAPIPAPAMALDAPGPNSTFGSSVLVHGWAVDAGAPSGTGIDAVHVWAYPIVNGSFGTATFLGAAQLGSVRPDVAGVFGSRFAASGFSLQSAGLAPGAYRVIASARSTASGTFSQASFADITIAAGAVPNPWMAVEGPAAGSTQSQPFVIAGWALDFGAAVGPGVDAVHVWAFRVSDGAATFLGAASYGSTRSDVAAVFGGAFAGSGYSLTASGVTPGTYDIGVYMHSTVTGTFNLFRVVRITVQ